MFVLGGGQTASDILHNLKSLVPEAVSVRSHALTTSSVIVSMYEACGIKYELNTLIEPFRGMVLKPFEGQTGNYTVLPFIYEDDVWLSKGKKQPVEFYLDESFSCPRIFNFHPIHLFLNTECPKTYELAKPYNHEFNTLKQMRNTTEFGIRDFFVSLVLYCKDKNWTFEKIKDGNWK